MTLQAEQFRRRLPWALLLLACFLSLAGQGRGSLVMPEHSYMIRPFMGMEAKDAEWYAQLFVDEAQPELNDRDLRVVTNDLEITSCNRVANCEVVLLREDRAQKSIKQTIMFKTMGKLCGSMEKTYDCYIDPEMCRKYARQKLKNFIVNHDKNHHRGTR
jgi:hypothetical protein